MKRSLIAAGAAAALIGGGAWIGLGSATATTAQSRDHRWPVGAPAASAAKVMAATKANAASDGSQSVLLRAHQVREADVDVQGDGFGPGDYFLFEENLRYVGSNKVVGRDSVRCTVGPRSFICDGTIRLDNRGKITIYGAVFRPGDSRYAVTGGTGDFTGVGGALTTVDLRGGDTLLAFDLTR